MKILLICPPHLSVVYIGHIGHIKKSHDTLYTTTTTKKSCRSKMPHMISSRSVIRPNGVSLSVSKSKLV